MTKEEQRTSLLTTIAVCAVAAGSGRATKKARKDSRAAADETITKQRERFQYLVAYVGPVCKEAFQMLYSISHRTLHVYRQRVREEGIAIKRHGGRNNQNHREIDAEVLVSWFVEVSSFLGEVVPVRVRMKKVEGTRTRRFYSAEDYTLLPSNLTWESLRAEYVTYLDDIYLDTVRPSESSFQRILKQRCPTIRIRSPRDQVCDQCAIYRLQMTENPDGGSAEVFGENLENAKAMRVEYKQDVEKAGKGHLVFIMDFAQNLTLPHTPDTPSGWYFLSLWSVSFFGVYSANDKIHHHYLYGESKGGQGADEVCNMLAHTIGYYGMMQMAWEDEISEDVQHAKLTVWADNAGGQDKRTYEKRSRPRLRSSEAAHLTSFGLGYGHPRKRRRRSQSD